MTTPAEELCLTCSLCCDGSLFGIVPLTPEEAETVPRAAGREGVSLEVIRIDGRPQLSQPCACLDGFACVLYGDRPAACQKFRCGILKSAEGGEITWQRAVHFARHHRGLMGRVVKLMGSDGVRVFLEQQAREAEADGDASDFYQAIGDLLLPRSE